MSKAEVSADESNVDTHNACVNGMIADVEKRGQRNGHIDHEQIIVDAIKGVVVDEQNRSRGFNFYQMTDYIEDFGDLKKNGLR